MKSNFLILFLLLCHGSQAQVTLTGADLNPAAGDVFYYGTSPQFYETAPGANQTWDFSDLYLEHAVTHNFSASDGLIPGTEMIRHLSYPNYDYEAYSYLNYTDSGQYCQGVRIYDPQENYSDTQYYVHPELIVNFPLSYGSSFLDTYHFTIVQDGEAFDIFDTIRNEVDGYGTFISPYNTRYNVLRVKTISTRFFSYAGETETGSVTTYEYYTFYNSDQPAPLFRTGFQTLYQYSEEETQHIGTDILSCSLLIDPDFLSIDKTSAALLNASPNPFSDNFSIVDSDILTVTVTDMQGRIQTPVLNRSAGKITVECADLNSGTYLILIEHHSGKTEQAKVLKL